MSSSSPLDRLADAIHAFFDEADIIPGAFITSWAVVASTARIQSDDDTALPLVSGAEYVFGPETSIIQLSGLAKYLETVAENQMYRMLNPDEDDD